jgi:predicted metal-dependent HD superfamily phosphohydrolase
MVGLTLKMELSPDIYNCFETAVSAESAATLVAGKWSRIVEHYNERHRYYHNWQHLRECYDVFCKWKSEISVVADPREVLLAIIYHDVIYEIGPSNNEEQSALYFEADANDLGLDPVIVRNVCQLIRNTTYSEGCSRSVFGDIDLSGLGAAPVTFRNKSRLIRKEYGSVSDEEYFQRRLNLMERFLGSPQIYHSELFSMLESPARTNLSREMKHCERMLKKLGVSRM